MQSVESPSKVEKDFVRVVKVLLTHKTEGRTEEMKFDRKCTICGKSFVAHNRNTKTCSPECSKELRKKSREAWISRHPDYMRDYFVEHRERYSRTARRERKEARQNVI